MRYRNALNALGLGAVEILQDAAVALPPPNPSAPIDSIEHPDHPARPENGGRGGMHHGGGHRFVGGQAMWHGQGVTHYHEPEYRHSDDCHLGCANQQPTGTTVPSTGSALIQGVPTSPFKPVACVIPSYQNVGLFIAQVTIGPFNAIEGDPIPAAAHSEVSLTQFVSWPTIQANSPIKFSINNANLTDITNLSIDVRGIRLRE